MYRPKFSPSVSPINPTGLCVRLTGAVAETHTCRAERQTVDVQFSSILIKSSGLFGGVAVFIFAVNKS